MAKKATAIQYKILSQGASLTAVHRTDRGSKYLGRSFTVSKEGKSKKEFEQMLVPVMEALLNGTDPI